MSEHQQDDVDLIGAIDEKVSKIHTAGLDISLSELSDMYDVGELIIQPEYQRLFRWSEGKQSRFIESILIGMPLPPIFVIEKEDNVYILIDGLQRISSYLHFRGLHPDCVDDQGSRSMLKLTDCDIVEELNGCSYDDLPKALQIKLRRSFIRVVVIKAGSDARLSYYMFKRLNTGGEQLTDQEIRNCTIRLLDDTFNEFITRLSENEDFKICADISERKINQKQDQELVLRFFAFKNYRDNYIHNVGDFMTEYMEAVSDPENTDVSFDYFEERTIFDKTFKILRIVTEGRPRLSRVYYYEAFTIGIQKYLDVIDPLDPEMMRKLKSEYDSIITDPEFHEIITGGGKNYPKPLQKRILFVENRLGGIL